MVIAFLLLSVILSASRYNWASCISVQYLISRFAFILRVRLAMLAE